MKKLQQLIEHNVPYFTMKVESAPQMLLDIQMPKGASGPPDLIESHGEYFVKAGCYASPKDSKHQVGKYMYRRVIPHSL